uniref:Uncharacterized protein isoform X1 n=2 Tax=Pogona vitticeps TaxID=103695 RepID=A0ABM5GQR0_9SAUR
MSTQIRRGEPSLESGGNSKAAAEGSATERERSLEAKRAPVLHEEPVSVRTPFSKHVKCLKDFMKDPKREEPLVGLEYILEIRSKGKKLPFYECELCQFNMELVPMIEHVTGQKHRKKYLMKHYPEKVKRNPNESKEEKFWFFKRIAKEVEKIEGLKMYKREIREKPNVPSRSAKKKARWSSGYKPENDPAQRQKVLEYMENFEITSDQEAAVVINIAQSLSKDLKAFCEKKATLKYIKTLPSLMSQGEINESRHNPVKPFESNKDQPGDGWTKHGGLTEGLAKLQSLLQQVPITSHTRADSSDYRLGRKTSLHGLYSNDLATVSALKGSLAFQPGSFHSGMNKWMKEFNQSASTYFQSTPAEEESPHFRSARRNYMTKRNQDGNIDSRIKSWDKVKESHDSKAHPLNLISYPPPKRYQAGYPSERKSSRYHDEHGNRNEMPSPSCSSESRGSSWPQQPDYHRSVPDNNLGSYPSSSSGRSHRNYHQQNAQLDRVMDGNSSDLITNIMNQIRGQDAATLVSILEQLLPHYPDLQKINIHALAQALSEMN